MFLAQFLKNASYASVSKWKNEKNGEMENGGVQRMRIEDRASLKSMGVELVIRNLKSKNYNVLIKFEMN